MRTSTLVQIIAPLPVIVLLAAITARTQAALGEPYGNGRTTGAEIGAIPAGRGRGSLVRRSSGCAEDARAGEAGGEMIMTNRRVFSALALSRLTFGAVKSASAATITII